MELKVKLHAITIKDENSGETYTVTTLRSAKDIADYIEESERDEMVNKLESVVCEALNK